MRTRRKLAAVLTSAVAGAALLPAVAATADTGWTPEPATYGMTVVKDVPITMADGTVLRAAIHEPTDLTTGQPAPGPFPVIVSETPYGKTLADPIPAYLVERGYLGVAVDVAGTGGSEGQSQLFGPTEAEDSVQVINWAAALPHSSGEVGMVGVSYLAIDQLFAAAAVGPNSPLKAIFPMAASVDPYRDLFTSGGIVNMESSLGLIGGYFVDRTLVPPLERPSDVPDAIKLMIQHGMAGIPFELTTGLDAALNGPRRFDSDYWQIRAPESVLPDVVRNGVAVYLTGGLYDVFQRGEPLLYSELQNLAAGRPQFAPMVPGQPVSSKYQLLFGPWDHGHQGDGQDINDIQLQWFDQWLKGENTGILDTSDPLHIVQPDGTKYSAQDYPVETTAAQRLYLENGNALGSTAGTGSNMLGSQAPLGDPLLFTGLSQPCTRSTQQWAAGIIPASFCGATDPPPLPAPVQQTYTTAPLTSPMTLAGPVGLTLRTTATSSDTMYVATLQDVAPDGTITALSGGAQLGSLRAVDTSRSWTTPDGGYLLPYHPLTADSQQRVPFLKSTEYDIEIRPVFATVPAGHRLRLLLGTGDIPHLLVPPMSAASLVGLSNIQHSAATPSFLELPVVGG